MPSTIGQGPSLLLGRHEAVLMCVLRGMSCYPELTSSVYVSAVCTGLPPPLGHWMCMTSSDACSSALYVEAALHCQHHTLPSRLLDLVVLCTT